MTSSRVRAAGDTHPGLQRENNEDRFFFDDRRGIYCVIDGVGGHLAGERAAEIAADTLRARLTGNGPVTAAQLRNAFSASSRAIFDAASRDRSLQGMACVATVAVVDDERVRFGHVGDTRLFKIRGGEIFKLTHDHSPVGELEDSGALSEAEAMRHPRRNEIYRDLGTQPMPGDGEGQVETGDLAFERDAALVLCTDGLSDLVSAESLRRIVEARAGSPALAVQELISAANDAGGKDNVTVLVVEGEAFADATAARGKAGPPRAAAVGAGPRTRVAAVPRSPVAAPAAGPARAPKRRVWPVLAALAIGILVGAGAALVAPALGWTPRLPWLTDLRGSPGPRTWVVGLDATADFATIAEALQRATAGDTVRVGPGEYREALVLPNGVALEGSRQSVLRPPLGARPDWTAITVQGGAAGRISGFLIGGAAEQPLGIGLAVEQSRVDVEDVEITGAALAGVEFRSGAQGAFRRSFVHDNPGAGLIVRAGAEPTLEFNVILHNGQRANAPAPGVLVEPGGRPRLVANGIGGNGGPAVAGWAASGLSELNRQNVLAPPAAAPVAAPAARRPAARNRAP